MKNYTFRSALPVWQRGAETAMNRWLIFRTESKKHENTILALTGSCAYNVHVNGEFVAFGPARAAHGVYRVDELDLSEFLTKENNVITITVAGYNINSFYHLDQPSFLCAELIQNGEIVAATGKAGFVCRVYSEHEEKVHRYGYQRTFTEVFNIKTGSSDFFTKESYDKSDLIETVCTGEKVFIERGCRYNVYDKRLPENIVSRGTFKYGSHGHEMKYDRSATIVGTQYPNGKSYKGYKLSQITSNPAMYVRNLDLCEIHDVSESADAFEIEKKSFAIANFGLNTSGTINFTAESDNDATIILVFDEIREPNGDVNFRRVGSYSIATFRIEKGVHNLYTFEPYTFQFIKFYAIGANVKITNLHSRFFGDDATSKKFRGNDEALKRIFDAAVETYRQNTFTIYVDCPSRERAGWLCDSFFTARVEKILMGNSDIERNFLENFLIPDKFDNHPDGMLPMCYPADHPNGSFIPNWAMWYVLELEEYLQRSGDRTLIDDAKERIYKLIKYFEGFENEYGLLENLEAWVFIDWSESNNLVQDVSFPSNMLYSKMLHCASRIYGDKKLAEKAERVKKAVNELSYVGPFYCDNAYRKDGKLVLSGKYTESCQNYAFFCDVATPESHPELLKILIEDFGPERSETGKWSEVYPANAFIGNYIRLEMLYRLGKHETVIDNIRGYFDIMAKTTGTLWEKVDTRASLCHGFASHVIYWLDGIGYVE